MKQTLSTGQWWLIRLGYLLAATVAFAGLLSVVLTHAVTPGGSPPAWANPNVMAVRRAGPVAGAQHEPNLLSNLDCSLVTYRMAASSTMLSGCFTETAFGLLDSDAGIVIFNGTDEGLLLLPSSPNQVLAPWPGALDLVALDAINTGGSYISLYKNPLASLRDQRNLLLQLTAKQLTEAPELALKDPQGQRLVINSQTLAFSDGGSWAVMETLNGSFVRVNLASLNVTAFAPAYGSQGSPGLLKSRVAISDNGRYVAIANDDAASLKVYDLTTCSGTAVNLQPLDCRYYDYRPFVQDQISGLQSIRHLRFVNNGLLSFEAITNNSATGGIYEFAPTAKITSLIDYLGLGDSYTSGEGAFDYLSDTDSTDNMCHLSARSYPLLLTHDLFSALGGHSVACSGAVINDIGSKNSSYRGQVRGVPSWQQLEQDQPALLASIMTNFAPGYVAQQRFVSQYQPAITTVSVGGDDIGFGDILEQCVVSHISLHISDNTCFNTYEDRLELTQLIDRTVPRWKALFKQLQATAPDTRLYAIGYPKVVSNTGNCAANVHLSKSELEFAEELVIYLNKSIQLAAHEAGSTYVDVSDALAGRRLCETSSYNVAVNGLTAGKDGAVLGIRVFGKESYHPNALGQELIEQAILKQTHNLTDTMPATSTEKPQKLLSAPKTGRAVQTRVPAKITAAKSIKAGKGTAVKASGSGNGLKAKTVYIIRLDGPKGPVIGTVISNDSGDIEDSAVIPDGTTPGGHTIDIMGENQAGQLINITQPIYVPADDTDSDGDGLDDTIDSCPAVLNIGQDTDQDGIDDTCDPFIGLPTIVSASSPPTPATNIPLVKVTPTLVSAFTASGSQITTYAPQPLQGTSGTPPISKVLGASATNPLLRPVKYTNSPSRVKPTKFHVPFSGLLTINWLLWTVLAAIIWIFLAVIGIYIGWRGQKMKWVPKG